MTRGTMSAKRSGRRSSKMRGGKHSANHEPKGKVTVHPPHLHVPKGAKPKKASSKSGGQPSPAAQVAAGLDR